MYALCLFISAIALPALGLSPFRSATGINRLGRSERSFPGPGGSYRNGGSTSEVAPVTPSKNEETPKTDNAMREQFNVCGLMHL